MLLFGSQDPFAKKIYMGRYFLPAINTWCRWVVSDRIRIFTKQNSVFRVSQ